MRFEIAAIHNRLGITTMYVTHDQTEAMVISNRIVVMRNGKVMQEGKPEDIYMRPRNKFVAGFMGTTCFLEGIVERFDGERCILKTNDGFELYGIGTELQIGHKAYAAVRPEYILLGKRAEASYGSSERNCFKAIVDRSNFTGELLDYQLKLGSNFIRAKEYEAKTIYGIGQTVDVKIDEERLPIVHDTDPEAVAV
jgi:iron(III) transport system ATP-binding protein